MKKLGIRALIVLASLIGGKALLVRVEASIQRQNQLTGNGRERGSGPSGMSLVEPNPDAIAKGKSKDT